MLNTPAADDTWSRKKNARTVRLLVGMAVVLSLGLGASLEAFATRPNWSNASSVPGIDSGLSTPLNVGGLDEVAAISCSSSRNCSEGGSYYDAGDEYLPFVATESNGSWSAQEVPGIETFDSQNEGAQISSLSCSATGNCAAGGDYIVNNHEEGFFVDESGGVWQSAQSPTTLLNLNTGGGAVVDSVSCSSDGACAAVGSYTDNNGNVQGFVASDANDVWSAYDVPSLLTLNAASDSYGDGLAEFTSLSCSSAGNCAAVGSYHDVDLNTQGFVASEVNGSWTAHDLPTLDTLNAAADSNGDGVAEFTSLSCSSAGNCAAGGHYTQNNSVEQGFVASEVNGSWSAYDVATLDALNQGGRATVSAVSCSTDGSCTAVARYRDGSNKYQGAYLTSTDGVWSSALAIAGLSSLNAYGFASPEVVSCGSAGNCALGGEVQDLPSTTYHGDDAFVASEVNGSWSDAIVVPGLQALNTEENAQVTALSCAPDGSCLAGGTYRVAAGNVGLEFVTSLAPETSGASSSSPNSPPASPPSAVTNLATNESPGTITASWSPGNTTTEYTCSLLYPSGSTSTPSIKITTSTTSCSFTGLDEDEAYGVSVVATNGTASSSSVESYANYSPPTTTTTTTTVPSASPAAPVTTTTKPKETSIVCVKGKVAKRIRAVDPHCPSGYHRRTA